MIKRTCGWTVTLMLVLAPSVLGQEKSATKEEVTTTITTERVTRTPELPSRSSSNAVAQMLSKRVPSVDWNETPFEEIINWLRDESDGQVNVVARWGPLGVESVSGETLINNLRLTNTTVGEVLNEVIDLLSEDGEIRYHGIGNTLRISTKQDFERKMYVRVYDVADLLFKVPNFGQSAPQIDLQQTKSSSGGGSGGGQSVFSGGTGGGTETEDSGTQADQRIEEELIKLRDSIQRIIAPETWDIAAGRGHIEIMNRELVVHNTIEVHEMIAGRFAFDE